MAKRIREDSCSTEFEDLDEYMSDDEPDAKPLTRQKSAQGLQVVGTWAMQLITDLKSQKGWMRVGNYVVGKSQQIEKGKGTSIEDQDKGLKTLTIVTKWIYDTLSYPSRCYCIKCLSDVKERLEIMPHRKLGWVMRPYGSEATEYDSTIKRRTALQDPNSAFTHCIDNTMVMRNRQLRAT